MLARIPYSLGVWLCVFIPVGCQILPCRGADLNASAAIYQEHWPKAQAALAAADHRTALVHLGQVAAVFPFEPSCKFEMARCYSRLGRIEDALLALEEAAQYGWSNSQRLQREVAFAGLQNQTRFAEIVTHVAECKDEKIVAYKGRMIPDGMAAPLVIFLHGLGGGPRTEVPYWKAVADDLGLIIVAPRAVNEFGPMVYGWNRREVADSRSAQFFDVPASKRRIAEAVSFAQDRFEIDASRVILAGFSQGAGVALRELIDNPSSYAGAVLICGLYQPLGIVWRSHSRKVSLPETFLLAGELDPLLERSEQLSKGLDAAGAVNNLVRMKAVGHEYPQNYTEVLAPLLNQLTVRKQPAESNP